MKVYLDFIVDVWILFLFPLIKYFIGPIVSAYAVWFFTNKKELRKERDNEKRQVNEITSKLKKIITLIKEINLELDNISTYSDNIEKMKQGDYSFIDDEQFMKGDEHAYFRLIEDLKESPAKNIKKLKQTIIKETEELSMLPRNLIPTKHHRKLVDILNLDEIKLDSLEDHENLLKELENIT